MARRRSSSAVVWVGGAVGFGLIAGLSYAIARSVQEGAGTAPAPAPALPASQPASQPAKKPKINKLGAVTGFVVQEGTNSAETLVLSPGQMVALKPLDLDDQMAVVVTDILGEVDGETVYNGVVVTPPASLPTYKGSQIAFMARHVFGKPTIKNAISSSK